MKIELHEITVKDLVEDYVVNQEEGVVDNRTKSAK